MYQLSLSPRRYMYKQLIFFTTVDGSLTYFCFITVNNCLRIWQKYVNASRQSYRQCLNRYSKWSNSQPISRQIGTYAATKCLRLKGMFCWLLFIRFSITKCNLVGSGKSMWSKSYFFYYPGQGQSKIWELVPMEVYKTYFITVYNNVQHNNHMAETSCQ